LSELDKLLTWINASDLTAEKKAYTKEVLGKYLKEIEIKDFQIKRLKGNLTINTRFLNKTVEDLETTVSMLQDSNLQLSNFAKIASHDLKSPLRSISSFSALLKKMLKGKLNHNEEEYFQFIETGAKSMANLIDDLLIYTRINAETLTIREENVDLLISEVINSLDYDIKKSEGTIVNNIPPMLVYCDSIKLKQVFQNLISNGIKFSSKDNNKPHIILDFTEDIDKWYFSVQDNGIGIEDDYKDEIFQEFKKLNGVTFEGTGMGLSIVSKIIDKHRGDIWVDSSIGCGSKFSFTICKHLNSSESQ